MAQILVRDVPLAVLEALKARAERNRRSLQQEMLVIIETSLAAEAREEPRRLATVVRERLAASGRQFTDSTPLIREDHER